MIPIRDNIPTRRFPVVTVTLIAINAAVWILYELPDLDKAVVESGWIPCEVNGTCDPPGPSWPVDAVTSMFMHGSWIHIIGNMLFLWIFGNNIEDRLGRAWFVVFYFAAGFAATALQTFTTLRFGTPEDSFIPNVGASGAIAGVLGAYFLLYPHARVLSFVILVVRSHARSRCPQWCSSASGSCFSSGRAASTCLPRRAAVPAASRSSPTSAAFCSE